MRKGVLLLGITLLMLLVMNISPALPIIQEAFKDHPYPRLYVMILFTIPSLALGIFSPICGKLVDVVGRKSTFIISLVIYAISGTVPAFLNSLEEIIVSRFILGISTATIATVTMTLITDYYSGKEREKMMSLKSVFVGIGGLVFLIVGGLLAQYSWRAPFLMNLLPLLLIVPAWIYLYEPEIDRKEAKQTLMNEISWKPMVHLLAVTLFIKMMIYVVPLKLPFLLRDVFESTPGKNGFILAFGTVASTIAAFFFPNVRKYANHHQIFTVCLFSLALGFFFFSIATSFAEIFLGLALLGFSFGWTVPNASVLVAELTPAQSRGMMMGVLTSCLFIGQFFTPFMVYPIDVWFGEEAGSSLFRIYSFVIFGIGLYYLYKDVSTSN